MIKLVTIDLDGTLLDSRSKISKENPSIRINTVIRGDPALWLLEWKRRGIVRSNSDAIRQAFRAFREKLANEDKLVRRGETI